MRTFFAIALLTMCHVTCYSQQLQLGSQHKGGTVVVYDSVSNKGLIMRPLSDRDKMSWNDAVNYIRTIEDSNGVKWRMPTYNELEKIFKKRSKIVGLKERCYWTSSVDQRISSRSNNSFGSNSMDGNVYDPGSSSEVHIETLNFFNGVHESFTKSESQFLLLVSSF